MEKDKPATYAMALNRDAQVQTLEHLIPFIPNGGTVVFVTSHWAHFYGQKPVYPEYESIAASKHAGEEALRAYIPQLARRHRKKGEPSHTQSRLLERRVGNKGRR